MPRGFALVHVIACVCVLVEREISDGLPDATALGLDGLRDTARLQRESNEAIGFYCPLRAGLVLAAIHTALCGALYYGMYPRRRPTVQLSRASVRCAAIGAACARYWSRRC